MTSILVAEDDPGVCDLLTDILRAEFAATVRCEHTGSLALQAIETAGFDLAIIDVNLPGISGYELARQAVNRNIAVLLSSGHPDADAMLKASECPCLPKPFRIADLLREAAEAMAHANENLRCVATALARMEAATDGLKADAGEPRAKRGTAVDDLRARAGRYRSMAKDVTDPRSIQAIQELAAELDREADTLEQKEQGGEGPMLH